MAYYAVFVPSNPGTVILIKEPLIIVHIYVSDFALINHVIELV